ncbi:MAG: helix-turn-helix transcriptional regulator [Rhodoferax sp.]|nr:helix-turn-helix transcriptional regulator [Rhodoferax sp.]
MKASDWIDQVKSALNLPSDYAAAKALHITRSAVSKYRSRESTLDEDTAISVAKVLNISPARVVLDQVAERAKSDELRRSLYDLCILC